MCGAQWGQMGSIQDLVMGFFDLYEAYLFQNFIFAYTLLQQYSSILSTSPKLISSKYLLHIKFNIILISTITDWGGTKFLTSYGVAEWNLGTPKWTPSNVKVLLGIGDLAVNMLADILKIRPRFDVFSVSVKSGTNSFSKLFHLSICKFLSSTDSCVL